MQESKYEVDISKELLLENENQKLKQEIENLNKKIRNLEKQNERYLIFFH
jgi:uncharacterized protein YlxW (UPF0749 family)